MSTSELTILGSSYRRRHLCDYTHWSLGHDSPGTMKEMLSCTSLPVLGRARGLHCLQKEPGAVHGWRCPRWRHLHPAAETLLLVWGSCMARCCTTKHQSSIRLCWQVRCFLMHSGKPREGVLCGCLAFCFDLPQIGIDALSLLGVWAWRCRAGSRSHHPSLSFAVAPVSFRCTQTFL